jgi:glyoxylase-like metal-dependent hydrolase (beta-lactamase superfamily II)
MLTTLLAPNPSPMTLDGTRTFLVGRRSPAVIDPGPDDAAHLAAVLAALDGALPAAILLTHLHPDHAAGAGALSAATGAPVRSLGAGLAPDERIATDSGVLRVVPTPGHAPEHACFLWSGAPPPHDGVLFAGDMFMGGGETTLVAPPEGNLSAYLESLDRIAALGVSRIHPAHGPPFPDTAATIERYRAHRAERIEAVVRALRWEGEADPSRLVAPVYGPDLDPVLRGAAEGSVHAILDHLIDVGRAVRSRDGRFRLHPTGHR